MNKKPKAKTAKPASCSPCVCVEFNHPCANEVFVAGTFNDWHPTASPMIRLDNGRWERN